MPAVPEQVAALCSSEGIELVGIADAAPDDDSTLRYARWIELGFEGSMRYLARHAPMKYRPQTLLPGCRSIIAVGVNYFQSAPAGAAPRSERPRGGDSAGARGAKSARDGGAGATETVGGERGAAMGRIARYAWGRDYHRVLGGKLRRTVEALERAYPEERFRSFSDATPLAERHYAEAAGIGFTGRNTLLISNRFGSWFLIGEILSTRHFPPSESPVRAHGACPGGCRRCLDVCPTGALRGDREIDASRCISYLTIEHRGSIPVELRPLIGDWLFGCDLCQEVCPLNVGARETTEPGFLAWKAGDRQELSSVLKIKDDAELAARFAGSAVVRAHRSGLVRNACVVAANMRAVELLPRLRQLCADPDVIVAEHARWAVEVLARDVDTAPGT